MRTQFKLASVLVAIAQFGIVACDHGRNYDPHHKLATPTEAKKDQAATPKSPASAPSKSEESIFDPEAAIADRQWCVIKRKNDVIFFVDRYVFAGDESHATHHDQLVFIPGQAPTVKDAKTYAPWTDVTDSSVKSTPELGVQAVTSDGAIHHPDAGDQTILFRDLISSTPIDVAQESIGSNGAVMISPRDEEPVMAFDCQDFSPTFVGLEKKDSTVAKPETAATPVPAPVAEAGTMYASFDGELKKVDVDPKTLAGSRWCSFKKTLDDTIVGTLEFGPKNEVTLNHFKASLLKMDAPKTKHFRKAKSAETLFVKDVRFQGNAIGAVPLRLRSIADAAGKRALIFDNLSGEAYPSSTAETFLECTSANDQTGDPNVLKNLTTFMNSTKR